MSTHTHMRTSAGQTRSTLSFGATFGIAIAVMVFVMAVIIIVSFAIYACLRVHVSRMQNNLRGTAAANSNFPSTILNANASSPNFAYTPLPCELPPSCPDYPTNISNTDFGGQPQLQAQQPVSSHECTQKHPIQPVPYGAPSYPQPTAESEGATPTAPQLHPESNN